MIENPLITITTHDGPFHADEILSVVILKTIFKNNSIIRTRDSSIIDDSDFVVDVGGEYSHERRRYDHHMPNPPKDENEHVFSSAGLIWYHYGQAYLRAINIPKIHTYRDFDINIHSTIDRIIRTRWIIPIDRWDNGVYIGPTPISELVSSLSPIDPEKSAAKYDEKFAQAVSIISLIFERACFHAADSAIAKAVYIKAEKEKYSDGKIIFIDADVKEFGHFPGTDAHFVIFPVYDHVSEQTHYNVRAIFEPSSKEYKTSFPKELCGTEGVVLKEATNSGMLFIHHTGFMAKAKTKEAALQFCLSLFE